MSSITNSAASHFNRCSMREIKPSCNCSSSIFKCLMRFLEALIASKISYLKSSLTSKVNYLIKKMQKETWNSNIIKVRSTCRGRTLSIKTPSKTITESRKSWASMEVKKSMKNRPLSWCPSKAQLLISQNWRSSRIWIRSLYHSPSIWTRSSATRTISRIRNQIISRRWIKGLKFETQGGAKISWTIATLITTTKASNFQAFRD